MCFRVLKVSLPRHHRLHGGEPRLKKAIHVQGLDPLKAHLTRYEEGKRRPLFKVVSPRNRSRMGGSVGRGFPLPRRGLDITKRKRGGKNNPVWMTQTIYIIKNRLVVITGAHVGCR